MFLGCLGGSKCLYIGHPGGFINICRVSGGLINVCRMSRKFYCVYVAYLYTQWWLWKDWDVYCCQHPAGAAQDRGSGRCLQHCPKSAPPASQHGPKCGKTSIS